MRYETARESDEPCDHPAEQIGSWPRLVGQWDRSASKLVLTKQVYDAAHCRAGYRSIDSPDYIVRNPVDICGRIKNVLLVAQKLIQNGKRYSFQRKDYKYTDDRNSSRSRAGEGDAKKQQLPSVTPSFVRQPEHRGQNGDVNRPRH
jgi:hypothetical protein